MSKTHTPDLKGLSLEPVVLAPVSISVSETSKFQVTVDAPCARSTGVSDNVYQVCWGTGRGIARMQLSPTFVFRSSHLRQQKSLWNHSLLSMYEPFESTASIECINAKRLRHARCSVRVLVHGPRSRTVNTETLYFQLWIPSCTYF